MTATSFTRAPDGVLQIDKAPDAVLRYGFDVADALDEGEGVASVAIAAQSGVTASGAGFSGSVVSCVVSGGTLGEFGEVTLRWTTTPSGRVDSRSMRFRVLKR